MKCLVFSSVTFALARTKHQSCQDVTDITQSCQDGENRNICIPGRCVPQTLHVVTIHFASHVARHPATHGCTVLYCPSSHAPHQERSNFASRVNAHEHFLSDRHPATVFCVCGEPARVHANLHHRNAGVSKLHFPVLLGD